MLNRNPEKMRGMITALVLVFQCGCPHQSLLKYAFFAYLSKLPHKHITHSSNTFIQIFILQYVTYPPTCIIICRKHLLLDAIPSLSKKLWEIFFYNSCPRLGIVRNMLLRCPIFLLINAGYGEGKSILQVN